ncbi:hypothetical protein ACGFX4_38775 [Kitasatospora sp. NPDC048365]
MKSDLPLTTDRHDALTSRLQALPGATFAGCISDACVSTGSGLTHAHWTP